LAGDVPARAQHFATATVVVQIELVHAAVAVVDAALLELSRMLELSRDGRAFRRRLGFSAATKSLAVRRALLFAPK
jgi:hypothetical protein